MNDECLIENHLRQKFGNTTDIIVTRYWDENDENHLDLMRCDHFPTKGVACYSTVGLSNWPLYYKKNGEYHEFQARLELLGMCDDDCEVYPNLLLASAFCIINSKWFCYPGAIYLNVLKIYSASRTMRHILFYDQYLWDESIALRIGEKEVVWLMAIPISDAERHYAKEYGIKALTNLLEERSVDASDLNRPSVV